MNKLERIVSGTRSWLREPFVDAIDSDGQKIFLRYGEVLGATFIASGLLIPHSQIRKLMILTGFGLIGVTRLK